MRLAASEQPKTITATKYPRPRQMIIMVVRDVDRSKSLRAHYYADTFSSLASIASNSRRLGLISRGLPALVFTAANVFIAARPLEADSGRNQKSSARDSMPHRIPHA